MRESFLKKLTMVKIPKNRKYSYFVGNVLVQVRHIFLPDYYLVLSLLKLKSVGGIFKPTKCLV